MRNLKRHLFQLTGYTRFRQRLFDEANDAWPIWGKELMVLGTSGSKGVGLIQVILG